MGFLSLFASSHWAPHLILDVVSTSPGLMLTSLFLGLPDPAPRILQDQPRHPFPGAQAPWSLCFPSRVHSSSPLCSPAFIPITLSQWPVWVPRYATVMLAPGGYRSRLVPWGIFSSYFKGLRWRTRTNICWISEKQTHLWNTFCTSNPNLWVW